MNRLSREMRCIFCGLLGGLLRTCGSQHRNYEMISLRFMFKNPDYSRVMGRSAPFLDIEVSFDDEFVRILEVRLGVIC